MTEFSRELPPYRLAKTHFGDDLPAVAAREMGDANRWPELVWLNRLVYPYLTDIEALAAPGVLLNGSLIKVPSPRSALSDDAETGQVYERDCQLHRKLLVATEDGDLAVVAGVANLTQQLQHRLDTPRGQLRRHPEYGCMAHRLKGRVNGPIRGALASRYVKTALEADYRVAAVTRSDATVVGDTVQVLATAEAIEGSAVDLTAST